MYFLKLQTGKPRFIPICHPESDTAVPRLPPRRPLRQEGRQQLKQNFRIPGSIPVDFHVLPCYIMVNMNENPYRLCRLLLIVTVIFTSLGNLTAAISSPTWSEEAEFLEKGFALAKTTEIARAAGVTHAMLHYYFRTKEKLFERIFREKVRLLAESLAATFDSGRPFMEQVAALAGAHFDFVAANPCLPMFILREIHLNKERREVYLPLLVAPLQATISEVGKQLEAAARRGEIRSLRTSDLMFSIASLNVMTFVGLPIAKEAFGMDDEDVRQFVAQRRAENIEVVLSRLRK